MALPTLPLKSRLVLQSFLGSLDDAADLDYDLTELQEAVGSLVDAVDALEVTVDTASTGLVDRVEELESQVNTAVTGILARLDALEAAP